MREYSDGWHIVAGYEVYVENNCIIRGLKKDINGNYLTSYPYQYLARERFHTEVSGVKCETFRRGAYEGRYSMQ